MKRVRSIINIVLGSIIAALCLTSCEKNKVEYWSIVKYGSPYIDTTAHCMYGVDPSPIINLEEDTQENE